MRDNPKGGELNPADNVRKRCKKNFPSVLSCIGKTTETGKSQFLTSSFKLRVLVSSLHTVNEETEGI